MSGFGTVRLLFCHQNEEPKIFLEVLSATTAFSLIFVSEYMLGSKVLICSSGRPSEAGNVRASIWKRKSVYDIIPYLENRQNFTVRGIIGNKRSRVVIYRRELLLYYLLQWVFADTSKLDKQSDGSRFFCLGKMNAQKFVYRQLFVTFAPVQRNQARLLGRCSGKRKSVIRNYSLLLKSPNFTIRE